MTIPIHRRIEFDLQILKVNLTVTPAVAYSLYHLSRWISLALLKLKCILKHISVFQNLLDSL